MEATTTQPPARKEKKGLSRLWRKVKVAFKNKEVPAATSSSTAPGPATATAPAPIQSKPSEPTQPKEDAPKSTEREAESVSKPAPPSSVIEADIEVEGIEPESEDIMRSDIGRQMERTLALYKKYNLPMDPSEVKVDETKRPQERVLKKTRMRVKYTCHSCKTIFGYDKVCRTCQHPKCSQCTSYPTRKSRQKGKKRAVADTEAPADIPEDTRCACHECQTGVEEGAEECPNCGHKICERCMKEAIITISQSQPTTEAMKKPAPSVATETETQRAAPS